jgi:hypothetical protein
MTKHSRLPLVLALLLTALAALVITACGGDDDEGGVEGPDPATITPASAPLYFEAVVKPEGDTKENLE